MSQPDEPKHPSGRSPTEAWYAYERYPYLLARLVLIAVGVLGVYALFHSVDAVLFPVLASLLIAYLLDPVVDRLEARGWTRTRAIIMLLLVGFGALGLFLVFLVPTLIGQIGRVVEGAPGLVRQIQTDFIPWVQQQTGMELPASASAAISEYGATLQSQIPTVAKALTQATGSLVSGIGSVAASLINAVMIPLFTFYFLRDFDKMRLAVAGYLPVRNRDFLISRIQKVDEVVGAWFRGQVEVALILGVLYAIGLGPVFGWAGVGVAAGIAVGVLAGVLNIIPYFGFAVGFVLSILMVLLQGAGLMPLLAVGGVFAVVQGLEGWVITPRIVGDKVGLSPVVVIIALLVGQELLGLAGVLLALPIAGALRVLMPDVIAYYQATSLYTGESVAAHDQRSFTEIALAAERERDEASQREAAAQQQAAAETP